MSALLAAAALLPGPLLSSVLPAGKAWRTAMDGMTLLLVGGLCLFVLIPHAYAEGGLVALALVAGAVVIPLGIHRWWGGEGPWVAAAALAVLAVHASLDGAALALMHGRPGMAMAVAVVAHRLPVGLAVFSAAGGARVGWAAILVLIAATWLGFLAGAPLAEAAGGWLEGALEAIVAGALLHVVFVHHSHSHHHEPAHE